jgi:S1-C subfamily serine protease
MTNALGKHQPGDVVTVTVRRGAETKDFTITLGGRRAP